MSIKRSRTKVHNGEKIQLLFEYGLEDINFHVAYGYGIFINYKKDRKLNEYGMANKLLKLFYELLDMDTLAIEKFLNIKIDSNGVTDINGKKINTLVL